MLSILSKYFPQFTETQLTLFKNFSILLLDWNKKVNLISRKDTNDFILHHLIHSLSVIKVISFQKGQKILDFGTGGGLPGIPLAIALPEIHFYLVDSILKKVKVVENMAQQLELKNIKIIHGRGEDINQKFDFVVCRGVGGGGVLLNYFLNLLKKKDKKSGIIFYKGGDLTKELSRLNYPYKVFDLKNYFTEEYFSEKKIIYL